jgi:cytochrome c-type biogenesis protein CcsB
MADGSPMPIVAGLCFLLAAAAYAREWRGVVWLGAAGIMVLAGAFAARGLRAGHWPLTGEYEFALAFALSTALVGLILGLNPKRHAPAIMAGTMIAAALLAAYARFGLPAHKRAIFPLPPFLDSLWFPLHVGTAALADGALTVGGIAGLVWLLRQVISGNHAEGADGTQIEQHLDRAIAIGFPLLTLSMIFGMIWAQVAWGRYWGWELKELWTLIAWLIYALYWHVRRRPHWQGRRLAWLALLGLGSILVTFLGVGWLARATGVESLHLF